MEQCKNEKIQAFKNSIIHTFKHYNLETTQLTIIWNTNQMLKQLTPLAKR